MFTVQTDGACDVQSGTGVVRRTVVLGGHSRRVLVTGAPGADMLAVSGRSLLEVPAVISGAGIGPGPTLELRGRAHPGIRGGDGRPRRLASGEVHHPADARDLRRLRAVPHNLLVGGRLVAWNTHHTIRGIRLARAS